MDPRRPGVGEPMGDLARFAAIGRLALEVPLAEADDATAAEVDRRQQLEG